MDKTTIAVGIFNKYADKYQDKFMNVDLYKASLDVFCRHLTSKRATILELACGPGNITQYLLSQNPELKILGTDLSPNMIRLAQKNNPEATFQILDSRRMLSLAKTFDGLMCGFLLPYLSKEEVLQLIKDATILLNENGVIYISTMEDDYGKSGFEKGSAGDEIFMYYHEAEYLIDYLENNGFEVLDIERKIYTPEGKNMVTDLLITAKKLAR